MPVQSFDAASRLHYKFRNLRMYKALLYSYPFVHVELREIGIKPNRAKPCRRILLDCFLYAPSPQGL